MFQQGSGIQFFDMKLKPAVMKRIEWLGRMNDRHIALLANNDELGLQQLATEYEERGMTKMANGIRLEIANRSGK
jgi:hypothetical protein